MSTEHQITKRAADGSMDIEELRQFLAEYDRVTAPEPGVTVNGRGLKLKVSSGMRGQVKSITVTVPGGSDQK